MTDALIGYTGFVGSTLMRERDFGARFNSKNIDEICGCAFDTVVCAGVSAIKWLANQQPEADFAAIDGLMKHLKTIKAAHFVLISTIDVYADPVGVTEADAPISDGLHPYGLHRLRLERFIASYFPKYTIIRLPGLFGVGLRKNLIFDMINNNQTLNISPDGVLQWYPMRRFAADLTTIIEAAPRLINIAVEPIPTELIRANLFPQVKIGAASLAAPRYDMRTQLASVLGAEGDYHLKADVVMAELKYFATASLGVAP